MGGKFGETGPSSYGPLGEDLVTPDEFLAQREEIFYKFEQGLLTREEAGSEIERLAAENPAMQQTLATHIASEF